MPSNGAELLQCVGRIRPELSQGECFGCQNNHLWHLLALFPSLISAKDDTQLFSCPLLSPVQTFTPKLQFKSVHSSPRDVQIFHNSPGEILANYEKYALRKVGFL